MIDSKDILADFHFLGNRVSNFVLETKMIENKEVKTSISFEFDYNVLELVERDNNHFGIIEFIVKSRAKAGKSTLFKIDLTMEGAFIGNTKHVAKERFKEMLELNGVVTLSQISRSYLLSTTSQSGINPPVRLPMINVVQLKEKKHEMEKENIEPKLE